MISNLLSKIARWPISDKQLIIDKIESQVLKIRGLGDLNQRAFGLEENNSLKEGLHFNIITKTSDTDALVKVCD